MFSSLCRAVRELRVSVPKLSVRSPTLLPVSHLRTVTTTNPNKAQPQYSVSLDLPVGQTIVPADSQLRDETLSKINKSLDEGPGRMFAVVHVRGFQHKITDGKSFNPCLSSAWLWTFDRRRSPDGQNWPRSPTGSQDSFTKTDGAGSQRFHIARPAYPAPGPS